MISIPEAPALERFGYSPKQANFLACVMLHSGYFLRRQIRSHRGKAAKALITRVRFNKHCTEEKFISGRGMGTTLFHITNGHLYAALGEMESRNRQAADSYRVRAKLMGLDYVLSHPNYQYLATEQDKLEYFTLQRGLTLDILPSRLYVAEHGETTRYFVDKFPIQVDGDRVRFCFMDVSMFADVTFQTWLDAYAPLAAALGNAEIVYVSNTPVHMAKAERRFNRRFGGAPILPRTVLSYFQTRYHIESTEGRQSSIEELLAYKELRKKYAGQEEQYQAWLNPPPASAAASSVTFKTCLMGFDYSFVGSLGSVNPMQSTQPQVTA